MYMSFDFYTPKINITSELMSWSPWQRNKRKTGAAVRGTIMYEV
jgi:hypothetical protein